MEKCLGLLTFLPMDEVRRLGALQGSEINEAKRVLAFEVTKMIHGEEEAVKAQQAAETLFGGAADGGSIPTTEISAAELAEEARLLGVDDEGRHDQVQRRGAQGHPAGRRVGRRRKGRRSRLPLHRGDARRRRRGGQKGQKDLPSLRGREVKTHQIGSRSEVSGRGPVLSLTFALRFVQNPVRRPASVV